MLWDRDSGTLCAGVDAGTLCWRSTSGKFILLRNRSYISPPRSVEKASSVLLRQHQLFGMYTRELYQTRTHRFAIFISTKFQTKEYWVSYEAGSGSLLTNLLVSKSVVPQVLHLNQVVVHLRHHVQLHQDKQIPTTLSAGTPCNIPQESPIISVMSVVG